MVSAVSQAPTPAAESTENDSNENRHWLYGRYFVPMPDLSDEARWNISQGRAWPVFAGLMTLLRRLELKGTEPQKAAACAGRIEHLGVNGLAAAIRMSPTATLRQLRFLERQGFIRTSQDAFTTEVDPATGRIARNYAKAPPKVIELTLRDSHYRPQAGVKAPQGDTHETNPRTQGDTYEPNPRPSNRRVRNERVSRERTSKEVRSSGTNRRQDASGPLGRPETPAAKGKAAEGPSERIKRGHDVSHMVNDPRLPGAIAEALGLDPAEVASTPPGERREELIRRFYAKQGWRYDPQRQTVHEPLCAMEKAELQELAAGRATAKPAASGSDRQHSQRALAMYVANCAKSLRLTEAEVIEIGRADKNELVRRLEEAGCDPSTGRRRRHQPTVADQIAAQQRRLQAQQDAYATAVAAGEIDQSDDTLTARQAVTAAVSLHDEPQEGSGGAGPAGDTLEQEEAAAGLREALAGMTPEGRDRARVEGERIDEHLDAGATEVEIDVEAAELAALIEQKRCLEQERQRAAERDMAELAAAKDREDRQLADLRRRLGSLAMRQGAAEG